VSRVGDVSGAQPAEDQVEELFADAVRADAGAQFAASLCVVAEFESTAGRK